MILSKRVQFWILIVLAFVISLLWSFYQSQLIYPANAAVQSIPALARGIGLSCWLSMPPDQDFSKEHLDSWVTEKDFKRFADWGLTHVRLPIEPEFLQFKSARSELIENHIAYVDRAIQWSKKYNLAIILDIHPLVPLKLQAGTQSDDYDRLKQLWIALAKRYRTQSNAVFYELLNEPQLESVSTWRSIAQGLVNQIRSIDTEHSIIVSGHYAGAHDYETMTPIQGDKLIYTFHFYEPISFTHQSSGWIGGFAKLRDLPYPFEQQKFAAAKARSGFDSETIRLLNAYQSERFDKQKVESKLRPVLKFRSRYNVPIYCGEFGVNRDAPMPDRANWNRDVIEMLQRYQFEYAFWEYRGSFGLMSFDSTAIDPAMLDAIGFRRS
ncbi:glycoside hydrolase family 5 protein [Leptolyngbya sp. NIES-2104]|uniref:glycoside hydrolase family 5 protein n=1 Tax=Leptolyngbya sp. NIES-2104 TaxID=1552121 RepID=UPI0006EC83A4|nr:cellulase family glycosylhydrolase [Leptolyngbya sp. NIES-2104]GAP96981.1 endoglucanase C [Leptolyngbya sp. NIES-2104]